MKFLDFVVLLVLLALLFFGIYFLWQNFPTQAVEFEEYKANIINDFPLQSAQFYPRMRYADKSISYSLSESCGARKEGDFEEAIGILQEKTILEFYRAENAQISVSCSNLSPKPAEEGHFIAGEGGPSLIINASKYSVILSGKIALYRVETCDEPQIAIHEILHALGFDHNSNESSIMYPITNCKQQIDQYIIDEINTLYSLPSLADLLIESVKANKTGIYLNFEVTIANYGFKDVKNSSLYLIIDNSVYKSFDINGVDLGSKKTLTISNLRIPRKTEEITLAINTDEPELATTNNKVEMKVVRLEA